MTKLERCLKTNAWNGLLVVITLWHGNGSHTPVLLWAVWCGCESSVDSLHFDNSFVSSMTKLLNKHHIFHKFETWRSYYVIGRGLWEIHTYICKFATGFMVNIGTIHELTRAWYSDIIWPVKINCDSIDFFSATDFWSKPVKSNDVWYR